MDIHYEKWKNKNNEVDMETARILVQYKTSTEKDKLYSRGGARNNQIAELSYRRNGSIRSHRRTYKELTRI